MSNSDQAAVEHLHEVYKQMKTELGRVIVGQDQVVEQTLMAIFCRGHALLVGVPGLAKTLLVSTLARALELSFKRIQFTPDLMPADITGTEVLAGENKSTGQREISLHHTDRCSHNRHPRRRNQPHASEDSSRAAGSDAGTTKSPSANTRLHPRPIRSSYSPRKTPSSKKEPIGAAGSSARPIHVQGPSSATRTSPTSERTDPPKSNDCPSDNDSRRSRFSTTTTFIEDATAIVKRQVPVTDHVVEYALASSPAQTRVRQPGHFRTGIHQRNGSSWGAGPRAGICLISAAKAHAVLRGRYHATTGDVAAVAAPVLRHRVITTFNAEAAGITSDDVIQRLIKLLAPKEEIVL